MIHKVTCSFFPAPFSYEIEIYSNFLYTLPPSFFDFLSSLGRRFCIITDTTVASLYGKILCLAIKNADLNCHIISIPTGERHKKTATKEKIEKELLSKQFGKDTCLIILGGGTITDLGGFIAATYCRGIPFISIPTTLLAMVDASIGGKTGINLLQAKNMIGTIYHPQKIIIDLKLLETLPQKELRYGLTEMLKYGLIADEAFFYDLDHRSSLLLSLEPSFLKKAIFNSCLIKKNIVEADERDKGKRNLLNFGHTIGHALESLSNYKLAHGEAVAMGLLVESYLSCQLGHCTETSFQTIKKALMLYLPSFKQLFSFSIEDILEVFKHDKKCLNGMPRFVLLEKIGTPVIKYSDYCHPIEITYVKNALKWMFSEFSCLR